MQVSICMSQVQPMLDWLEALANGRADKQTLDRMLDSEDYAFEFARYQQRVIRQEFRDYLLHLPQMREEEIANQSLRLHHSLWKDALEHPQKYREGLERLQQVLSAGFQQETKELMERCYGPVEMGAVKLVITLGIGQSFGYPYGDGMHMDFLQLVGEDYMKDLSPVFNHELHHILFNRLFGEGDAETLEGRFCFFLAGEGLAIKFANFAPGKLSCSLCPERANEGLDERSMEVLNGDFEDTWKRFADTIRQLREGRMDQEELEREMEEYWLSPCLDPAHPGERLLQSRAYSFGNEVWGSIYDAFGREVMLDTLRHPDCCVAVFSAACRKNGQVQYTIEDGEEQSQ